MFESARLIRSSVPRWVIAAGLAAAASITIGAGPAHAAVCNGATGFAGGTGSAVDPYQVATADQLCLVRNYLDRYFVQTANIDLSTYAPWSPIGANGTGYGASFTGSYAGGGRTITGLQVAADGAGGLFAALSGSVISDISVSGTVVANPTGVVSGFAGLVAGSQYGGSVTGVRVQGSVTADYQAGGFVGRAEGAEYRDVQADVVVSANSAGGLFGIAGNMTLSAAAATGAIDGAIAGGLAASFTGTMSDSYSVASVSGTTAGGLAGSAGAFAVAESAYWDTESSGQASSALGTGLPSAEMKQVSTFTGWAWKPEPGSNGWGMCPEANSGYPFLWAFYATDPCPLRIPDAPTSVTASRQSQNLSVSWTAPFSAGGAPVAGYTVQQSANGGADWTTVASDTGSRATTFTATGLAPGGSYLFRVAGLNEAGQSPWSDPSSAASACNLPTTPGTPAAVDGAGEIYLSWGAASGEAECPVTGHLIEVSLDGGTTWLLGISDTGSASTSYTVMGLWPSSTFVFRVAARNAAGIGDRSPSSNSARPAVLPGAPTGLVGQPGAGQVALLWSAGPTGGASITGYRVEKSADGGSTWMAATPDTGSELTSYTVTGLTNGVAYSFRVAARNLVGEGPWSTVTSEAPYTVPDAPSAVTASVTGAQALVQWNAPGFDGGRPVTSYRVSASSGVEVCESTTTQCAVTGLTRGATYTFTVVARNAAGTGLGARSSSVSIPDPATAVLTASASAAMTGQTIVFDASSSSAASGRAVSYAWDMDGNGSFEVSGGAQANMSWPTAGTYTVRVLVTTPDGSTATASAAVVAFEAPPPGEAGVSIDDGAAYTNSRSVVINVVWPSGATAMRVSNDGGFAAARTTTLPLLAEQAWNLDDTVAGQFTKNVYVRFEGPGINTTQTFSDDIIFDNTAPIVSAVEAQPTGGASLRAASPVAASKTSRTYLVRTKAKDDRSGVGTLQVNVKKSAANARTLTFAKRARAAVKTGKAPKVLWIRVQDRAGNWSAWKKAPVR